MEIFRVKKVAVFPTNKLHDRDYISLEGLGFTEQDQGEYSGIKKLFQEKNILFNRFNVPSNSNELFKSLSSIININ